MGPDGHVASLFPGRDLASTNGITIIERDSPKPPAERLSFSFEALNRSQAVWFLVAGEEKAQAVADALTENSDLPAAKVEGTTQTIWFLDQAAASGLASSL